MSGTSTNPARKRGRPTADEREQRRDQILDAAVELFVSSGYGQVTLDEVAAAARVAKRTIYSYFGDKAEVFTAAIERFRGRALDDLESDERLLEDLATRLVYELHSDDAVGLHRLMIGESAQFPELADRFYTSGPGGYIELLAGRLWEGVPQGDRGHLAEALFGLLLGEAHRRRLLGLSPAPTREAARDHARAALAVLRIVGGAER
ncbi:TetR/AcrR family transcriptional regulator [Microbacterium murale]|uniref:TetR/AcrR family transcriptional repressor of mexJK operon n=1 Tax=Microbacterium murale TaxID=1081040 RepID=A0ABU0P3X2_9MICO|nr:TetR/AcrR family transcriptional regulator [Microbacterium murale]MDQ0642035.1 TetR/AcrR family transcriptional repressor of mexJK operon [Microbacterium murale]